MTRTDDPVLKREAKAIRRLHRRAEAQSKELLKTVIEIGRRLTKVKARVGHGHGLPWLRQNFEWSDDTAQN